MSEDVSATMRVGITVILVAALVATVLNLMVMSNSLLSGGQTTLQSGIDSVSTQEFAPYDNDKVSGTQVTTALSMFQGRDVAIIIQTKAFAEISDEHKDKAINYGAIVTSDGDASARDKNMPKKITSAEEQFGANIITSQAKTAYVVTFSDADNPPAGTAITRKAGSPHYTAYLHNTNGLVDSSYDTIGTTELGNAAFILGSARFSSVLIKDPTGSVIGIFFKQLQ